MKKLTKNQQLAQLRRAVRKECYRQIDGLLACSTELPRHPDAPDQAVIGTVMDDLVLRCAMGYGINVSLQIRHPDEAGMVAEDPSITEQAAEAPKLVVLP